MRALIASLVFGLLLFQLITGAEAKSPPVDEISFRSRRIQLKGVRYPNPEGPPVLLIHGLAENTWVWKYYGQLLYQQGFDVWMGNLRHHGQGAHRSTARSEAPGTYGFTPMITEDLPAMVEHIYRATGKKLVIAGHSMGGMVAEKFVVGIKSTPRGVLIHDPIWEKKLADTRIAGLVEIGSPTHLRDVPFLWKAFSRVVSPIVGTVQVSVPALGRDRAPTEKDAKGISRLASEPLAIVRDIATYALIPKETLDTGMLQWNEFRAFMSKGTSKLHSDILSDFGHFTNTGRFETRDHFNFENYKPAHVPVLLVAGERDGLVPPQHLSDAALEFPAQTPVRIVLAKNRSHVDLVVGEGAARDVGAVVARFMRDPASLGPPDRTSPLIVAGRRCGLRGRVDSIFKKR